MGTRGGRRRAPDQLVGERRCTVEGDTSVAADRRHGPPLSVIEADERR